MTPAYDHVRAGVSAHHLMRAALSRFGKEYSLLSEDEKRQARQDADRSVKIEILVLTSLEARGVIIPTTVLDQTLTEVMERYDSSEEFLDDLHENSLTVENLRDSLERELRVEAVLERVAAGAPAVEADEVRAWYDSHLEKFAVPETRQLRHILITVNDDFAENTFDEAYARISKVREQALAAPAQFAELAERHSECPSALEGGFLGNLPRGQLYAALDEAAFRMAEGAVSHVLESEAGFHLIFCEKVNRARRVAFEEAEPKIREALTQRRRKQTQRKWMAKLISRS